MYNIKIIFLEDSRADYLLVEALLKKEDAIYELFWAKTGQEYKHYLRNTDSFDLVLSNYKLQGYTGLDALNDLKSACPEKPFVILTGTLGNEKTVEIMKAGADDIILKSNILKLPLVIQREYKAYIDRLEKDNAIEKLSESEHNFRNLVNNAKIGVYKTNYNGDLIFANNALLKMFGYNKEDAKNFSIADAYSNPIEREQVLKRIFEEKIVENLEINCVTKSGDVLSLLANITLGNDEIISGIVMDITERIKTLEIQRKTLEERERLNRIKSNFFSNMSHELRTPMVGILGFAQLIESDSKSNEIREMASMIYNSGKRLMDTLNKILELSDMEFDIFKLKLSPIDPVELINNVLEFYKYEVENKGLELKLINECEGKSALGDERLFKKCFSNLIQNAVKFTDKGEISIRTRIKNHKEQSKYLVEIKDSGIGIPVEKLLEIFEEFVQGSDGIARHYEGAGLGLTITKKYMELMNGNITVRSSVGVGSIFALELNLFDKTRKNGVHTLINELDIC